MSAITADPLTLPKLPALADQSTRWRPITKVVTASRQMEGEGFVVRRPFPGMDLTLADPFLLLDQMGEVDYAPGEAKGAPWHPHRGFETVTYMIDGAMEHTDSAGGGGLIQDGSTQWMTAGSGIMHSELPPQTLVDSGGLFHGVQLWVNLPAAQKWNAPRYQGIGGDDLTLLSSPDGGVLVRLIAGDLAGFTGPGTTQTPIVVLHATVAPGAQLDLPWQPEFNALAYSLSGSGSLGVEQTSLRDGQLAVLGAGDAIRLTGNPVQEQRAQNGWEVLLLGGLPIREPIARYGPFVMNTKAEIIQAIDDFNAGRIMTQGAEDIGVPRAAQG
jgi:redox-sensitive bicupin YhaK (pirin superfamily)